MPTLWSVNGLSVELGIDRRTLGKKLSNLRPDGEGQEAGKTVRRWHLAHVLDHLQADRPIAEAPDVRTGRARLVQAQARKMELEVAAMENRLIPEDDVVPGWQLLLSSFRARCLSIPSKLAPRLVVMNERKDVQTALNIEIRAALSELSRYEHTDLPVRRVLGRPRGKTALQRP
jgi:hypothetical protein